MSKEIIERLKAAIARSGKSARAVSLAAGMSDSAVRGIERNPDASPTVDTLAKIARALDVAPEWLAFGVGEVSLHDNSADRLPIIGEVAAGLWLEVDSLHQPSDYERAPVLFSPEWPIDAQYGLRVRGTSINRTAMDGDVLRCIDIAKSGIHPRPGDLVVVQRTRLDGRLREVTAKFFSMDGENIVLSPDSTDPIHKPILLKPGCSEEDVDVAIIAVVDFVLRPVRRDLR